MKKIKIKKKELFFYSSHVYSFFLSKQQDNKLKKISAMKTTFVNQEILIYIKRRTSLNFSHKKTERRNDTNNFFKKFLEM